MFYMNLMKKEQTLFAKLEGKLIRGTTHQINDYLIPFIEKNQIKTLVCDCSTLKKMDLEGRYALLNVKIKLKKQKEKFCYAICLNR